MERSTLQGAIQARHPAHQALSGLSSWAGAPTKRPPSGHEWNTVRSWLLQLLARSSGPAQERTPKPSDGSLLVSQSLCQSCRIFPTRFPVSSVQSLSRVDSATARTTACQSSLVHHQLLEPTQTHVFQVGDAIQPSHPLSSPSPPALNLSQHQGLFQGVSSSHQVAKVLELQLQHQSFQRILR